MAKKTSDFVLSITIPERKLIFDYAWEGLAEQGACDAKGGCEYRRVRAEWVVAGYPLAIRHFIRERANIDAEGRTPSERCK
jgi:hypothetical protein